MDKAAKIIRIVKDWDNIPTLKSIYNKIYKTMHDFNEIPIKELSESIEKDIALSTKILKIINSPFFGLTVKIGSIERAVVLLGFNTVKSIILGTAILNENEETMKGLWGHSLFVSLIAKALTKKIQKRNEYALDKFDTENILAAAIIHDIGRVIIAMAFPKEFALIVKRVEDEKRFFVDVENEVLKINHELIGSLLLKEWNFPESIYIPIMFHHNPVLGMESKFVLESIILNIADILTNAMGIGFAGDYYVEPIRQELLDFAGIDKSFIKNLVKEVYPLKGELEIYD